MRERDFKLSLDKITVFFFPGSSLNCNTNRQPQQTGSVFISPSSKGLFFITGISYFYTELKKARKNQESSDYENLQ